jgi:hypothetical protein
MYYAVNSIDKQISLEIGNINNKVHTDIHDIIKRELLRIVSRFVNFVGIRKKVKVHTVINRSCTIK